MMSTVVDSHGTSLVDFECPQVLLSSQMLFLVSQHQRWNLSGGGGCSMCYQSILEKHQYLIYGTWSFHLGSKYYINSMGS